MAYFRADDIGPWVGLSRRQGAPFLPLRDEARLYLVRPESHPVPSISLEKGSYLCINLAGEARLRDGPRGDGLATDRLHILRQHPDAGPRLLEFRSPSALAAIVFFSERWCAACPQGPACKVARFLLHGAGESRAPHESVELDENGSVIARSLLDAGIERDADALLVERTALALLSWAYARWHMPAGIQAEAPPLHPQAALKVRQAAEILRRRIGDPPTIRELSACVGLNESDLKRCFRCLYGKGIACYSRERRMETARDLLARSPLGIAAIACEVGFSNPSQFARAFRRHFNVNPSEFRRPRGDARA